MTGNAPDPAGIDSLLIANRGEIAARILRTASAKGIRCVAVYHFVDRKAPTVGAADAAFEIFGDSPVAAYLDGAQIIETAKRAGASGIHPGYGFLAENAEFAQAVMDAGLIWVGPDPSVIRLMGDKMSARAFAEKHGVPVATAILSQPGESASSLAGKAAEIGLPLIVKAAAGGGGKGMSVVREAPALLPAIEKAQSEASRYFGDGRVYCETFVERPRHVEVQIAGDRAGAVIHLGERDCSAQRRFQKVIEEAPAPALDETVRRALHEAAVKLASAAAYTTLGTVEFLVGRDGGISFLEMNTRLQVEHPVTEMITGLDLVDLQLELAAGKPLPIKQNDVKFTGHAIELRICAERPVDGFLPSAGRVLRTPEADPPRRLDHALAAGMDVGAAFDSLLGKFIVHGSTRDEALEALRYGTGLPFIPGIATNAAWLARLVRTDAFRHAAIDTGWIERDRPGMDWRPDERTLGAALAAAAFHAPDRRAAQRALSPLHRALGAWHNGTRRAGEQSAAWTVRWRIASETGSNTATVSARNGAFIVALDGGASPEPHAFSVTGDDTGATVARSGEFETSAQCVRGEAEYWVKIGPDIFAIDAGWDDTSVDGHDGNADVYAATMPGTVIRVETAEGAAVQPGDPLLVIESMKLETTVTAWKAGVVAELTCGTGQAFDRDTVLVRLAELT